MLKRPGSTTHPCRKACQALSIGACLLLSSHALAVDLFLQVSEVPGESQDAANAGAIDVLAWSWGIADDKSARGCRFQDLSLTKYVDIASPLLLLGQVQDKVYPEATLKVRYPSGVASDVYSIVFELVNVKVTSISTGGSGGEARLTENVSLGFESATYTYTPIDGRTGAAGSPESAAIEGC